MKKLIALTLAVVLIVSALPFTVFARTAEGMYDGYYYTANLTTTKSSATTKMTYAGTTKIKSDGTIYYTDYNGKSQTMVLGTTLQQSTTSATKSVSSGSTITLVKQYYYVKTTQLNYIEVSPS